MKKYNSPSVKNETWARYRFNIWRRNLNLDCNIPLEDLPFPILFEMLCKFFQMVCKLDNSLYPPASLMNIYMSFNRLICRRLDECSCSTGVNEPKFKITEHPLFLKTTRAVNFAMQRSKDVGIELKRRKVEAITYEEERLILDHPENQANHGRGAQKRFALYCFIVFLIQGNTELHGLRVDHFTTGVDNEGRGYLR
jgi:hypothetical protein